MSSDFPCAPEVTSLDEARQAMAELLARQQALERENAVLLAGRRQAEQDFATATHLLHLTGELAKVGGWQVDLASMKLIWTRETFRISEIDSLVEPDLGNGINLFAPPARPVIAAAVQAAIDHGTPYDLELPIITAKGRHRWVRTQGQAIQEGGKTIRLIGTFQDITASRQAREELREFAAHHLSVFDSLSEHIAVLDASGVIVSVNQAWRRYAEANGDPTSAHTAVGTNYLEVCRRSEERGVTAEAQRASAGIQAVLNGDQPVFTMEYQCTSPDAPRWFTMQVSPVVGAKRGVVVSHADITARKQAELSARMAMREIENRQFAMDQHAILAVTDLQGRITQVNDLFCVISGYKREELLGQDHRLINSGTHPSSFFKNLWATLISGAVWHGEVCNRAKDGSLYWVSTTAVPLRDTEGKIQRYMAIRTDITQRKQAEARMVEAKERAERLNIELKGRIAQANDLALKAERASEVKSAFVANMSHEIRTPMNGIMGMIEVLLNTPLNVEQADYARTAYRSAESLLAIINDILDFSKLEAQRLVLEQVAFDLHELIFQVAELFRSQLSGRPLEMLVAIATDVPRFAVGDPGRIRQILSNLVGNAVKFTEVGHIRIAVSWSQQAFVIAVSDTGIGIPTEHVDRLFTPFTQVDASYSRKYGGTGLGLAISRRFAVLMNGTLDLTSVAGQGSTFTLILPLAVADGEVSSALVRPANAPLAGVRIMVIDDNELSSQLVCEMLAEVGARAETCASGRQALDTMSAANHDPFAAAVVDLRLRGMSGLEIAKAVRAHPTLGSLPLVMLTGSGQPEEAERMAQGGFNAYLVKPVRARVFHAVLAATITRCRTGVPGLVTQYDVRDDVSGARKVLATSIDADVLLVEDHEVNQKIATVALGKLGARVSLAENGRTAVAMATKHRYDVILMDCQMPEMDGYEATQAIRIHEQRTSARRMPIIAMTANVMPGSRERCLAAGMDDYLAKPFKLEQIEAKLRRWLAGNNQVEPVLAPRRAAAPMVIAHGELPLIDAANLREIERSDPGMALTILQVFQRKLAQDVAEITHQLQARDLRALSRTAHKIKGSSGAIGALVLQAVANDLELAALGTEVEPCRALVISLEHASQAFLAAVRPESLPAIFTPDYPTE
jgi:two-component system, sensor histidine kinase and response regulator